MKTRMAHFRVIVCGTLLLASAASLACSTDASHDAFTERDSAGVLIAENRGAPAQNWTISAVPQVEIGAVEGDSAHLLHEVSGALVIGNGTIVIANSAAPMLRWFDGEGRFVRGTGRSGGAPGEFQSMFEGAGRIHSLFPLGDSTATWEFIPRRMQVFDANGRFVRAVALHVPDQDRLRNPQLVGRLGRPGFVGFHVRASETTPASGIWRDTVTYSWWSESGAFAGSSVRLPGYDYFHGQFRGQTMLGRPAFARVPIAWADGDRLLYASSERFEIALYESGILRKLIRTDGARRAVRAGDISAYITERMKEAPQDADMRREWQHSLEQSPFPDSLPSYRRIRLDRTGALWAQEYDIPGEENVAWQVFDDTGRRLARVTIPRAWQITDIGVDYVLVLARNDLDVEVVRRYGLQRGG